MRKLIVSTITSLDGIMLSATGTKAGHLSEWLSNSFSIADILMADVLRLVDRFDGRAKHPSCRDYVARATARPSFIKAHADQMAHFAAAD